MKLPTNSYADVSSRGSLEPGSECCNQGQTIDTFQHSAVPFCEIVAYHFAAEPLFLLYFSTSHLQLTGAALAGQKFDELNCWKGGIL